jgi:ABC-type uncharacterized transport system involved in gliding motility auxiliary subunit
MKLKTKSSTIKLHKKEPKVKGGEKPNMEKEAKKELNELQQRFSDAAKRENTRLSDTIDSEYWVAICFQTREQKDEFLKLAGWLKHGDKYLDGMQIAKTMGVELKSRVPKVYKIKEDEPKFKRIALKLKGT